MSSVVKGKNIDLSALLPTGKPKALDNGVKLVYVKLDFLMFRHG